MIRRYSERRARRILADCAPHIMEAESAFGVPCACMQAILYRELTGMDWMDPLADLAVILYWRFRPVWDRLSLPAKRDSSTGYGQVFACSAISAINFAAEKGFAAAELQSLPTSLDAQNPEHVKMVWFRLHRDVRFNILAASLCLLQAADEMTGSTDFSILTPEELQLTFTRYNANTRAVTAYGRETYRYYQTFHTQGGSL